jgi:hypothetical protein
LRFETTETADVALLGALFQNSGRHWQLEAHTASAPGKIVGKDKLLEIDIGRLKIKHV